jgi:hypothetical protein
MIEHLEESIRSKGEEEKKDLILSIYSRLFACIYACIDECRIARSEF